MQQFLSELKELTFIYISL